MLGLIGLILAGVGSIDLPVVGMASKNTAYPTKDDRAGNDQSVGVTFSAAQDA